VLLAVDSAAKGVAHHAAAEHGTGGGEVEGRIPPRPRSFAHYVHFTDAGADSMTRSMTAGVLGLAGDLLFPPSPKPAGQQ
jgi:hypothetical protein